MTSREDTADKKDDDSNGATAWLVLVGLCLLGGIQLYRTHVTPWTTQQLARINIDGTQTVIGPLTAADLAILAAALLAALVIATLVRTLRQLTRRTSARR